MDDDINIMYVSQEKGDYFVTYIARDRDNKLWSFSHPPTKNERMGEWICNQYGVGKELSEDLFSYEQVNWGDSEPLKIFLQQIKNHY